MVGDVKGKGISKKKTKLKFKKQKQQQQQERKPAETPVESDENVIRTPPKQQPRPKPKQPPNSVDYFEWGPSVNGYRFVNTSDGNLQYKQRHQLVGSSSFDSNSYTWSYMDLPSFKSSKDSIEERYKEYCDDDGDRFIYDDYYESWESFKNEDDKIIFPLFNQSDELSLKNVENFLKSSGDLVKVLKIERIRWHPDKMLQFLKLKCGSDAINDELKGKITTTFQIINEIWESTKESS